MSLPLRHVGQELPLPRVLGGVQNGQHKGIFTVGVITMIPYFTIYTIKLMTKLIDKNFVAELILDLV